MDEHGRYQILDQIRGITLLSMFLYHGIWDLVYLFGRNLSWYHGRGAYLWQQSICWTFILLSGFCQPFGKRKRKRAAYVFGCGVLISAVTLLLMPENRVLFGVLTLLDSCMFLWIGLEKVFSGFLPAAGLAGSVLLFLLTRNVNGGWLGFEGLRLVRLPESWYRNLFSAGIGFPAADFFSVDYFPLLPWVFLFSAGYFLNRLVLRKGTPGWLETGVKAADAEKKNRSGLWGNSFAEKTEGIAKGFAWLGRHSLLLYMLHQPVIYGLLWAANEVVDSFS